MHWNNVLRQAGDKRDDEAENFWFHPDTTTNPAHQHLHQPCLGNGNSKGA